MAGHFVLQGQRRLATLKVILSFGLMYHLAFSRILRCYLLDILIHPTNSWKLRVLAAPFLRSCSNMASKSFFLFLGLILMSVIASAHRPLVAERHEANTEPYGMEKMDGQREKMEDMKNWKMRGKRLGERDDALKPIDGGREKMDMGKWLMKGKGIKHDDALKPMDGKREKMEDIQKWEMNGKRVERNDAPKPNEVGMGVYDAQVPGADAGFHFNMGPIGFGLDGGLQWGDQYPVYVIPYSQPYVVVSPYSGPYTSSPPYPNLTPYQQPGSGYAPPQPGQGGPTGGYGQGPYQKGWGYGSPGSSN